MGCDLVYSNRALNQLRAGKLGTCRVWYVDSGNETSKAPVSIRMSLGPNQWDNSYVFPPKASHVLSQNRYYWIEGSDVRYLFVDSIGDAWIFRDRVDFEMSIGNYARHGPSFHLHGAVHYSQAILPRKVNLIASRYARVLKNQIIGPGSSEPNPPEAVVDAPSVSAPYDQLKDILDFEFNKPPPPKRGNPLGLDFEAIAREAIEEKKP